MKTNLYLILFLFLIKINSHSQIESGIVNYEISINSEKLIKGLENKNYPLEHKQFISNMFKNSRNINYQLHFNSKYSTFFYIKSLEDSSENNTDENFTASFFGENTYFTDLKSKSVLKDNSFLENKLIKQPILNWNITSETKKIGNYNCYKATTIETVERDNKISKTKVVVWFTSEIPINFGPKNYNGLPGLVLEINKDIVTIKATNIILNPVEKKLNITKPKGDIISYKESELIFKEMLDNRKKMN